MSVFHLNVHLTKRVCFSPVAENAQLHCCLRGATEGKFRKIRVNWKVGGKKRTHDIKGNGAEGGNLVTCRKSSVVIFTSQLHCFIPIT